MAETGESRGRNLKNWLKTLVKRKNPSSEDEAAIRADCLPTSPPISVSKSTNLKISKNCNNTTLNASGQNSANSNCHANNNYNNQNNAKKNTVDFSRLNVKCANLNLSPAKLSITECIYLDGNQLNTLPEEISQCTQLKILSASDNDLMVLPIWIASLIQLETLDLSKNDLTQIPESLKCLRRLKSIALNLNPIESIDSSLLNCNGLTELYLSDCCLQYFPATLGRLINLQTLEARNNGLQYLPQSVGRLSKLQMLDLGCNRIKELNFDSLKSLEMLDLSRNQLVSLSELVCFLQFLTHLNVAHNNIQCLSEAFGCLKKLEVLQLDYNKLVMLPSGFCRMHSLKEVSLANNSLITLPKMLSELTALEMMLLDDNLLKEIPAGIGDCTKLTVLSLRGNAMTYLPESLWKLVNLIVLDVRRNKLTNLPLCLKQLKNLKALWLTENQTNPKVDLIQDLNLQTKEKVLTCYLLPQDANNVLQQPLVTTVRSKKLKSTFGLKNDSPNQIQFRRKVHFKTASSPTKKPLSLSPFKKKLVFVDIDKEENLPACKVDEENSETENNKVDQIYAASKEAKLAKFSQFYRGGKASPRLLYQLDKMKRLEQKSQLTNRMETVTFVRNNIQPTYSSDNVEKRVISNRKPRPPSLIRPYAMVDLKTLQSRLSLLPCASSFGANDDRAPVAAGTSAVISRIGFSHEYETIFDLTKKSIKPTNSNLALQHHVDCLMIKKEKIYEKASEFVDLNRSF